MASKKISGQFSKVSAGQFQSRAVYGVVIMERELREATVAPGGVSTSTQQTEAGSQSEANARSPSRIQGHYARHFAGSER